MNAYPNINDFLKQTAPVSATFYSIRVRVGSGGYHPCSDEDTTQQSLAFISLRNLATKFKQAGYSVELNESGWFVAKREGERTISAVIWEETE